MFKNLKIQWLFIFSFVILTAGCNKSQEETEKPMVRLNSLSMNVDGQFWEPEIIGGDSCYSRFSCESFFANQIPFYKIRAYKDSLSGPDFTGENTFFLQMKDIQGKGVYNINEPYSYFTSYARFIKNDAEGNQKIYDNNVDRITSKATIDELLPEKGLSLIGIRGSFSGVLHNIKNQNDSIVITDCKFIFKRINRYDFRQCQQ